MVTEDAAPPLQLVDHRGQPFTLREVIPLQRATVLYTFRGHW